MYITLKVKSKNNQVNLLVRVGWSVSEGGGGREREGGRDQKGEKEREGGREERNMS